MNVLELANYRLTGLDANEANMVALNSVATPYFNQLIKETDGAFKYTLRYESIDGVESRSTGKFFGLQLFDESIGLINRDRDGQLHILCQITDARLLTREFLATSMRAVMDMD